MTNEEKIPKTFVCEKLSPTKIKKNSTYTIICFDNSLKKFIEIIAGI